MTMITARYNHGKSAVIFLISLLGFSHTAHSQPVCQFLAYDGFDYGAGNPLFQLPGGTGWGSAWNVQGSNVDIPGYQIKASSILYDGLVNQANFVSGGANYFVAGRSLDLSASGPFSTYLAGGAVSVNGKTVWASALLRKDQANDTPVWLSLHGDGNTVYVHKPRVSFGFFGAASKDAAGTRYWSLQINDSVYRSEIPIIAGQAALLVASVTFDSNTANRVQFFVNPAGLGSNAAPVPALTQTVTGSLPFRSIALYLGFAAGNGAADEIRLADSWRCVTPTPDVPVNLPPTAAIAAASTDGAAPLTVTLDAAPSSDAEGPISSYEWSFGDGTPNVTGSSKVTHVYRNLGILRPSLTVTDNTGQKNTGYQNITVRDANGTFPCLSSVNTIQHPSCGKADGKLQVNSPPGATFSLRNSQNQPVTVSASNTFHNLPVGTYQLSVKGLGQCSDHFTLYMKEDKTTCPDWTPSICDMDIGMNLDGVNYYSRERAFRDYMKSAGAWIPYQATGPTPWDSGTLGEMPVDADGYPTQIPYPSSKGPQAVRSMISADGHMPYGDYVLLYDGMGSIDVIMASNVKTAPGRITFTFPTTSQGLWINLTASSGNDPVRNIRILKASELDAAGNLLNSGSQGSFNANFLEKLRPFKVIRFLNWSGVNPAPILNDWDKDRTRPTRYTQRSGAAAGVAVEYMVELGNLLGKDIWLTIPHTASDAYLTQMAIFFRDHLDPKLNIFLEYSDEAWNFAFSQAQWVDQNGPGNLNYPRKYVERAVHLFKLWQDVFGQDKWRVKRLFNVQSVNPWYSREVLAHAKPEDYDYISPSWYFGFGGACEKALDALGASATATDVLDCVRKSYMDILPAVQQNYLNTTLFGKEVINYEGGQSITSNGRERTFQAAIYAAQIDPQIYGLYQDALTDLRWMGSKMAMAYQLAGQRVSKYGSWGHLEDVDQAGASFLSTAPKYQALLDNIPQCPPRSAH